MTAAGDLPEPPVRALAWLGDARTGSLVVLDQTLLPAQVVLLERTRWEEVASDIRRLAIRGAPLLGVAGAYAVVLAGQVARPIKGEGWNRDWSGFHADVGVAAERIASVRPTAVNLRRGVTETMTALQATTDGGSMTPEVLLAAAQRIEARERAASEAIARHGATLLQGRTRLLTHCNAGALVTPGLGTALAPIYALHHRGVPLHVWVDETRPLLQGMRLTAYELGKAGVPYAVVTEGAAFGLMRAGKVDAAIVGADRICANGDVVNKVGTYGVALGCRHHGIPFYVAAPRSTFDPQTATGDAVKIEQRRGDADVYLRAGTLAAGAATVEPAFDVTPAALVTAYVMDDGVWDAGGLGGTSTARLVRPRPPAPPTPAPPGWCPRIRCRSAFD